MSSLWRNSYFSKRTNSDGNAGGGEDGQTGKCYASQCGGNGDWEKGDCSAKSRSAADDDEWHWDAAWIESESHLFAFPGLDRDRDSDIDRYGDRDGEEDIYNVKGSSDRGAAQNQTTNARESRDGGVEGVATSSIDRSTSTCPRHSRSGRRVQWGSQEERGRGGGGGGKAEEDVDELEYDKIEGGQSEDVEDDCGERDETEEEVEEQEEEEEEKDALNVGERRKGRGRCAEADYQNDDVENSKGGRKKSTSGEVCRDGTKSPKTDEDLRKFSSKFSFETFASQIFDAPGFETPKKSEETKLGRGIGVDGSRVGKMAIGRSGESGKAKGVTGDRGVVGSVNSNNQGEFAALEGGGGEGEFGSRIDKLDEGEAMQPKCELRRYTREYLSRGTEKHHKDWVVSPSSATSNGTERRKIETSDENDKIEWTRLAKGTPNKKAIAETTSSRATAETKPTIKNATTKATTKTNPIAETKRTIGKVTTIATTEANTSVGTKSTTGNVTSKATAETKPSERKSSNKPTAATLPANQVKRRRASFSESSIEAESKLDFENAELMLEFVPTDHATLTCPTEKSRCEEIDEEFEKGEEDGEEENEENEPDKCHPVTPNCGEIEREFEEREEEDSEEDPDEQCDCMERDGNEVDDGDEDQCEEQDAAENLTEQCNSLDSEGDEVEIGDEIRSEDREAASYLTTPSPVEVDIEIRSVEPPTSFFFGGEYIPTTEARATVKVKSTNQSFNFFTSFWK